MGARAKLTEGTLSLLTGILVQALVNETIFRAVATWLNINVIWARILVGAVTFALAYFLLGQARKDLSARLEQNGQRRRMPVIYVCMLFVTGMSLIALVAVALIPGAYGTIFAGFTFVTAVFSLQLLLNMRQPQHEPSSGSEDLPAPAVSPDPPPKPASSKPRKKSKNAIRRGAKRTG